MGFLREITGLVLVILAWFNLFEVELPIRILMFILGFDMMSLTLKIGIFAISYFGFQFLSPLAWTLLILVVIEAITSLLLIGLIGRIILKPIVVFIVGYLTLGLELALILATIDFFLNLGLSK